MKSSIVERIFSSGRSIGCLETATAVTRRLACVRGVVQRERMAVEHKAAVRKTNPTDGDLELSHQ